MSSPVDPNDVMMTGENSFVRLSHRACDRVLARVREAQGDRAKPQRAGARGGAPMQRQRWAPLRIAQHLDLRPGQRVTR